MQQSADRFYKEYVEACQLRKGDIIDVGSDLVQMALLMRKRGGRFDANLLIDELQKAVGEEGTILIRTFNWDFCHGVPFDRAHTPSKVGSLGNAALKRPDFRRTKHALYSWCVWGKEQPYLTEIDPVDSFGGDSIFAWLEEKNAMYLRLGNTLSPGVTCLHRAEQRANLPYRYIKPFTGEYIDYDGTAEQKTYTMFVRDLDYEFLLPEWEWDAHMESIGLQLSCRYEGIAIAEINLRHACQRMYQDILDGRWSDWVDCRPIRKTK